MNNFQLNNNENTVYQKQCDVAKAQLRIMCNVSNTCVRREERSNFNNL